VERPHKDLLSIVAGFGPAGLLSCFQQLPLPDATGEGVETPVCCEWCDFFLTSAVVSLCLKHGN